MALRQVESITSARPYAGRDFVVIENPVPVAPRGRLPRAERPLTYAKRYTLREVNRIGPRESGAEIPLDRITGRSKIGTALRTLLEGNS